MTKITTVPQVPMQRSWLIQRLEAPPKGTMLGMKDNPFNFGGGMVNGGLSPEAMDLFREIFSFAYMGSAEFEFGAVPKAFQTLVKAEANLVSFTIEVPLAAVPQTYNQRKAKTPLPEGDATIYVLCPAGMTVEVTKRITEMASGKEQLKDGTMLTNALNPEHKWDHHTQGWLEIDNGFMFFTNQEMFTKVAALFGVTP